MESLEAPMVATEATDLLRTVGNTGIADVITAQIRVPDMLSESNV